MTDARPMCRARPTMASRPFPPANGAVRRRPPPRLLCRRRARRASCRPGRSRRRLRRPPARSDPRPNPLRPAPRRKVVRCRFRHRRQRSRMGRHPPWCPPRRSTPRRFQRLPRRRRSMRSLHLPPRQAIRGARRCGRGCSPGWRQSARASGTGAAVPRLRAMRLSRPSKQSSRRVQPRVPRLRPRPLPPYALPLRSRLPRLPHRSSPAPRPNSARW